MCAHVHIHANAHAQQVTRWYQFRQFFLNPTTSPVINYTAHFKITFKFKLKALEIFTESPTVLKFLKWKIKHFCKQTYTKTNIQNQFRMHREYFLSVDCLPLSRRHHQATDNAPPFLCAQSGDEHTLCCLEVPALHTVSSHMQYSEPPTLLSEGQRKIHPRTGHEAPYEEKRFSSTPSLTRC